jgi:cytochrome c-type biogenesis protein CcmH/NrfF
VEDAPVPPVPDRRSKQTFANMLRSLVPLVLIILAVVWWTAFRQSADVQPVKTVDPSTTVQLAANRAGYPLLVPTDLPRGYRPTSVRTDAGNAGKGDPVTLEIGYVTPKDQFAEFVVSDDPRADAVTGLLADATPAGSLQIGGDTWTRATRLHERDEETVLSRTVDGVTVVVSGSASDAELETVAGSVQPYSG